MRKRFLPLGLIAAMLIILCGGTALASETRASKTLSRYSAIALSGDNEGEFKITYDVLASGIADEVGVSSIKIYKSNGSYVTTITGTTGNGMLRTEPPLSHIYLRGHLRRNLLCGGDRIRQDWLGFRQQNGKDRHSQSPLKLF